MIGSMLRESGSDAVECGNVGRSFPLAARERHDVLVVECSSFQLMFQESFHPAVSVLLNIAPDHLDWHGTFGAYRDAKSRIYARQEPGDAHVGNRDDPEASAISAQAPCDIVWFRVGSPGDGELGFEDGRLVARVSGVRSLGEVDGVRAGYRSDAAAAAAAAIAFGVPTDAVERGLASFTPAPHRGDVVAVASGVRFVDNSKATNVHAAIAAIRGTPDAVLIAGGRAKGVDLSPLADATGRLAGVVAIGESADQIVSIFEGSLPVRKAGSIEEATRTAFELAVPGGVVLLAPACASWDMFADYGERGDRFAAEARAIEGRVGARG